MEITTLLEYSERSLLRAWLQENHSKEKECWVVMSRSKTPPPGILPYIDVVEEALCFGWIDSTLKKLPDGRLAQRLSPRRKNSHWTKLNMDRCMDLEDRGLMTPAGRRAFENAYGWGYQVFHPTPEQRRQMIEEAWDNALLDWYANSPLNKDYGGKYTWDELNEMPLQDYILKYIESRSKL